MAYSRLMVSHMRALARKIMPYLLFPLLMGGGIWLTFGLIGYGIAPMPAYAMVSLVFFLAVFGLEKVLPHRPEWTAADGQELNDFGHGVFGTALGAGAGEALGSLVFGSLGLWLAGQFGHGLWPAHLPFVVQVLLVYLLADLGRYLQHRLMHHHPWLWRFHALHHSVNKLGVLKNSRSHLVERLMQPLCMFGLILALGAPPEVIFWYLMPNSFLGMLDHSNLDVRIGPLAWVINGPAEHRLHHSRDALEGNRNFGSALLIWDMLFGTYANPRPHYSPQAVGIENDPMPAGFLQQLLDPMFSSRPNLASSLTPSQTTSLATTRTTSRVTEQA
ncbi:MAG: sterol desaturase [Candidatus Melainabacteria bacterium HGW-Melainabacteria-1]|nr:MAG: sterol desaturase [Candidatus Melainabacteria bacterium HGW-Melainabacteria-1]